MLYYFGELIFVPNWPQKRVGFTYEWIMKLRMRFCDTELFNFIYSFLYFVFFGL